MAKEGARYYFDLLLELAKNLLESAVRINASLGRFHRDNCDEIQAALHGMRQKSKLERRNIRSKLYSDFITPFDREDLLAVADGLCLATDRLYEAYANIGLYRISKIRPDLIELNKLLCTVCSEIFSFFAGFYDYKNKERLLPHIDAVLRLTAQSEEIRSQAFEKSGVLCDSLEALVWLRIYDGFEKVLAACRSLASRADLILLKNA